MSADTDRPVGTAVMPAVDIPQVSPVITDRPAAVSAIAASPWAPMLAIGGQQQIVLYQTDNDELLGVLPFDEGQPQSIRFSRDGGQLIVGGGTHAKLGLVAIYDVQTGERLATIGDELDVVLSGDANAALTQIALGGPQKRLRIFDARSGEIQYDIDKHTDWIYAVAFSPDGVLIASADRSGGLHLWESATGRLYMDLPGHTGGIRAVDWRDDSNVVGSAGDDGTVRLWDVANGNVIKSIKVSGQPATSIDFDHDGNFLVGAADDHARWYDASGNLKLDLPPLGDDVLEVAVTHDSARAIYGDWSGRIVSVALADVKDQRELASNPPAMEVRVQTLEQRIAAAQTAHDAAKSQLDTSRAAHDIAVASIVQYDNTAGELQKQRAAAEQAIAAAAETLTTTRAEIQSAAIVARDLSDAVIAARVVAGDSLDDAALITAESNYASHLSALATKRQSIATIEQQRTAAAESQRLIDGKLAAHSQTRAKLDTDLAAAKTQLDQSQAAWQPLADELERLQTKREALVSR